MIYALILNKYIMEIFNNYREQLNYRMKIHYYLLNNMNKRLKNIEINKIKVEFLLKNNDEMNKKIINLTYLLIISYLIIFYLIFVKEIV